MNKEQARKLIRKYRVPPHIALHCEKVAKVAVFLGENMIKRNIPAKKPESGSKNAKKVDMDLLECGALLHDLFKVCELPEEAIDAMNMEDKEESKKIWKKVKNDHPGMNHAELGYEILKKMNEPVLAKTILKHEFVNMTDEKLFPETWEEKIVNYADKRVLHDKIVTLRERIVDGRRRYVKNSKDAHERSARGERNLLKLEKELFEAIGLTPDAILYL